MIRLTKIIEDLTKPQVKESVDPSLLKSTTPFIETLLDLYQKSPNNALKFKVKKRILIFKYIQILKILGLF